MHPFIHLAKLLYRSKAEKTVYHSAKTHTDIHTFTVILHLQWSTHTEHSTRLEQEWSRVDRPVRRICLRVLINLSAEIGVFIRIFVKGTQKIRSEPSETTVLSYDFIKSAIKCSLVWGAGSDKPSFFFPSDLYSSWSASCWGTVGMLVGKLPTWDVSVWETQIPQGLLVMRACGYSVLVYKDWSGRQQLSQALWVQPHRKSPVYGICPPHHSQQALNGPAAIGRQQPEGGNVAYALHCRRWASGAFWWVPSSC